MARVPQRPPASPGLGEVADGLAWAESLLRGAARLQESLASPVGRLIAALGVIARVARHAGITREAWLGLCGSAYDQQPPPPGA